MTPQGGTASGTYDHKSGTVTDDSGRKSSVSHVRPEGSLDYSHLPADLRAGIAQYDQRVSSGEISFPHDSHEPVGPGIPMASSGGGIGSALGQQLTQRLKMYEEAKVLIDARYAASLVSGSYQGSWLD